MLSPSILTCAFYLSASWNKEILLYNNLNCVKLQIKFLYFSMQLNHPILQDKQEMDHRISAIAASYNASEGPSKRMSKKNLFRKKFGKT